MCRSTTDRPTDPNFPHKQQQQHHTHTPDLGRLSVENAMQRMNLPWISLFVAYTYMVFVHKMGTWTHVQFSFSLSHCNFIGNHKYLRARLLCVCVYGRAWRAHAYAAWQWGDFLCRYITPQSQKQATREREKEIEKYGQTSNQTNCVHLFFILLFFSLSLSAVSSLLAYALVVSQANIHAPRIRSILTWNCILNRNM